MATPLQYSAEDLIESVRNLGFLTDTGTLGVDDPDILRHINEANKMIVSILLSAREEYFIKRERIPMNGTQSRFRIPHRAYLNKLRHVMFISPRNERIRLYYYPKEELTKINYVKTGDTPYAYYLEDNFMCLVPEFDTSYSGFLEIAYPGRPNDLVMTPDCRIITMIDFTTNTVLLNDDVPTNWDLTKLFDIHSPHSGSEWAKWDMTPVLVAGNTIQFSSTLGYEFFKPAVEVGDYVCLAETSGILPIPRDLHPLVIRATCLRIAEAQGNATQMQLHKALFDEELQRHYNALRSRDEGHPLRMDPTKGVLRGMRRWY